MVLGFPCIETAKCGDPWDRWTTSDWQRVKHRIPQGSLLGPLLYVDDIPLVVRSAVLNIHGLVDLILQTPTAP